MRAAGGEAWGALDRYQAHFIVRGLPARPEDALARTVLATRGRFGARRVESARWEGGRLAGALNADEGLLGRVAALPLREARIYVEPTAAGVRIRGGWAAGHELGVSRELFGVYDAIAGHVRSL